MSAYEYAFTLTPGRASRARSLTIACAAIAAVCVLSSTVVMRELVGAQPAHAATASLATPVSATPAATSPAARTWALEPRWWPGEIRQIIRPASTAATTTTPTVPDSDLTFAKGYQLRLAARQVTQPADAPAQLATTAVSTDSKPIRTATTARKATTIAQTETPEIRRVSATRIDGPANPLARFDAGTRALGYDEQRSGERGFAEMRRSQSRAFFGTLY